jgi:hypothetical protein
MNYLKQFFLFIYFFAGSIQLNGQVDFQTEAPSEVNVGEPFEVSFVLKNEDGNNPKFPNFDGFKVLTGPSVGSSTSIFNSQRSSTLAYSFTLVAQERGNKVIGIATIMVGKRTYYTAGTKINVVDAKDVQASKGTNDGWAIISKAEPSKQNLYVGEQLIMNYKFYYGEQLGVTDRPTLPPFKDFFIKRLEIEQQQIPGVKVGNRMYNGVLFDAIVLFPQTTGQKEIPPAVFHLEKQDGGNDPFNPFGRSITKSASTNSTKVTIKPLPSYEKKDFSGVVGTYTLDGQMPQNNISTDQSSLIRLKIKGNGDVMQLTPPQLTLDPSLEVFPPKQISSTEKFEGNQLTHLTEYEYVIKPKKVGSFPINASLVFFDPIAGKYTTTTKALGNLEVSQGAKKSFSQFYNGEENNSGDTKRYIILLGSLLLAGLIYFFGRPKKIKPAEPKKVNANLSKIELLNQRASTKLAKARAFMENNESEAFFKEVEISINQVVQERFKLSNEDLTKQRLKEVITSAYTDSVLGDDYMGIFTKVDMARYAGSTTQNMNVIYEKASQFIKDFEGRD